MVDVGDLGCAFKDRHGAIARHRANLCTRPTSCHSRHTHTTRARTPRGAPADKKGLSRTFVPPAGVEPATWWVEATRSIQLSYGGAPISGIEAWPLGTSVLRVTL